MRTAAASKQRRAPWTLSAALGAFLGLALAACTPRSELAPGVVQVQLGQAPTQLPANLQRAASFNGPPLRVLLRRGAQGLKVSASGGLRLRDPDSQRVLAELPANGRGRLAADGNGLSYNGRTLGLAFALVEPLLEAEPLKVAGRRYRGHIGLQASGGQLMVLNVVGLEDYLKGVLPSEVPADWPLEAQKAQAVAARSFALAQRAKAKPLWDVDDSVSSQVYKGLDAERPRPVQAVDGTRGLVLSHAGNVIEAFFHSNSGGHTADVAEVWGAKIPYLQGVLDGHSEGQKHYAWTSVIPRDQAEKALVKAGHWQGFLDGIAGRGLSESGRWLNVELMGRDERRIIKASALRSALGVDRLRSTRFNVRLRGDDLVFEGLGWGHGVGLSQEGAFALAQRGWTYARILQFYYPGTSLAQARP